MKMLEHEIQCDIFSLTKWCEWYLWGAPMYLYIDNYRMEIMPRQFIIERIQRELANTGGVARKELP